MKSRRILSIIGLILAAVLLLGIGFAIGRNEVQASVPDATDAADAADDLDNLAHTGDDVLALDITVTKVDDNDSQSFSPEEIGNNFNQGMGYRGVSDVYIYLNRTSERLEDALKNGDITEDDQKIMEEDAQKATDASIKDIDKIIADKEKEIMEV